MIIPFGKHYGKDVNDVFITNPDYLRWMLNNADHWWVSENRQELEDLFSVDTDNLEYTLSDSQAAASSQIVNELTKPDGPRMVRLQGGAGYGKSFTTTDIAAKLVNSGYSVKGMAASYVATQQLGKSLDPVNCPSSTIARALALAPVYDGPKERYEPTPDTDMRLRQLFNGKSAVIVDEYSMVGDDIAALLKKGLTMCPKSKLLVVGDMYQLPCPSQDTPSVLDEIEPVFALTTPMRYAEGSRLHKLEIAARFSPYTVRHSIPHLADYETVNVTTVEGSLYEDMVETIRDEPDQTTLMLTFRRDDMVRANNEIRKRLFPDAEPGSVLNGEKLRVQRTTFMNTNAYGQNFIESERFYSGTFVTAVKPRLSTIRFNGGEIGPFMTAEIRPGWHVPLILAKGESKASQGSVGGEAFNTALGEVTARCQDTGDWTLYRQFRNRFLMVAYGYATTVHRAQGASVDNVFVRLSDVFTGGKILAPRLQYVALTRAKKKMTVLL